MNGEVPLLSKRRTFLFKKVSSLLERSHSVIHDEIYFHCLLNQLELPADLLCASLGIKYVRIWNLRKVGGKTTNKEHNTLRTERLVWIFPALFEERSRGAGAAAVPAMAARGRCAPAGRCGRCASRSAPESRGIPERFPNPGGSRSAPESRERSRPCEPEKGTMEVEIRAAGSSWTAVRWPRLKGSQGWSLLIPFSHSELCVLLTPHCRGRSGNALDVQTPLTAVTYCFCKSQVPLDVHAVPESVKA